MADDLRSIASQFRSSGNRLSGPARDLVRKTAADIEGDAKRLVPVDTGNLKNSITHQTAGNAYYSEAEIGPTADYGIYVELGTSRMTARPYMGPAADRHLPLFEQALGALGEAAAGGP